MTLIILMSIINEFFPFLTLLEGVSAGGGKGCASVFHWARLLHLGRFGAVRLGFLFQSDFSTGRAMTTGAVSGQLDACSSGVWQLFQSGSMRFPLFYFHYYSKLFPVPVAFSERFQSSSSRTRPNNRRPIKR